MKYVFGGIFGYFFLRVTPTIQDCMIKLIFISAIGIFVSQCYLLAKELDQVRKKIGDSNYNYLINKEEL